MQPWASKLRTCVDYGRLQPRASRLHLSAPTLYPHAPQVKQMSGGQRCRLVLAAAFWSMPHVICLDEPTNYLDNDTLAALTQAAQHRGAPARCTRRLRMRLHTACTTA